MVDNLQKILTFFVNFAILSPGGVPFLAGRPCRPFGAAGGAESHRNPGTYAAPDSAPSFVTRQKKAKTRLNLRFKNPLGRRPVADTSNDGVCLRTVRCKPGQAKPLSYPRPSAALVVDRLRLPAF